MFTLTPAAAEQIIRAAAEQSGGESQPLLRVAAKLDESDGDLVYGMGFDEEREDDLIINANGVAILISPRSQPLLENTTLDFTEVKTGEFQFLFSAEPTAPDTEKSGGGCSGACS